MPPGLLNLLTKDDILDLTAYVLAGNREDRGSLPARRKAGKNVSRVSPAFIPIDQ